MGELSNAIREGWIGIDKLVGQFQDIDSPLETTSPLKAACAIGAACRTRSSKYITDFGDAIELFPQLQDELDPESIEYGSRIALMYGDIDGGTIHLKDAILYYNDDADLSKERVIELVEQLGY